MSAGGNDAAILVQRIARGSQSSENLVEFCFEPIYAMVFENDVLYPVEQVIRNGRENIIFTAFTIDFEEIDGVQPMRLKKLFEGDAW